MSRENREFMLAVFRGWGKTDALDLRSRAKDMDGTAIIAEEAKIPAWNGEKDYSSWAVGAPAAYDGNVFTLLVPHNAAHYPDANPANAPALWSVRHTKDAEKAKPWLAPSGTSGLYMAGECCTQDGKTWRCLQDSNPYSPAEYAQWWEEVIL